MPVLDPYSGKREKRVFAAMKRWRQARWWQRWSRAADVVPYTSGTTKAY